MLLKLIFHLNLHWIQFLHKEIKISDEEGGTFKIGTELNETIIQQILDAKIYTVDFSLKSSLNSIFT